jgi:phytoene synthase
MLEAAVTAAADTAHTPPAAPAARAAGSSFYAAMRILPRRQREAMFEIYAFCRAVDDIADDSGPRAARLAQLEHWRADIEAVFAGAAPPHLAGLAHAIHDFSLARDDFLAVIDGMRMDVAADIRAPDAATLDLYCDRVASAVGRLSVRVFGLEEDAGRRLAHHLGRALQLTNVLRDLDEDAAAGRLYLPIEALRAAGIAATEPQVVLADPALAQACAPVAAEAWQHFAEADAIMARAPRRAIRAPRIMAEVYRAVLQGLLERGFAPPRRRIRLRRPYLLWIMLRHALL